MIWFIAYLAASFLLTWLIGAAIAFGMGSDEH